MNLDEIRKHMQERDFAVNGVFKGQLADETRAEARERVLRQLADDVPDLVVELERVNLQIDALKKMAGEDLKWAIGRNASLIVALQQIYKNEGPGLDGSPENASGRIARLALETERVTEKRKDAP